MTVKKPDSPTPCRVPSHWMSEGKLQHGDLIGIGGWEEGCPLGKELVKAPARVPWLAMAVNLLAQTSDLLDKNRVPHSKKAIRTFISNVSKDYPEAVKSALAEDYGRFVDG